mmetsp:Transcript_35869/g.54438  ORF Transcript_35869/g.54438 Transcript_35869/m.54438 type:complete len:853 (+) Transcript_35869:114-2672(+)
MDMHQAWNSKTDDGPRPGGSVPLFLLADAADDCHQEQLKIGSKAATNAERRSPPGPSDDGSLNKRAALEQEKWLQHLTQQGVGAAYQNSKKQCAEAQVANNSREFVAASAQDDATRWAIAAALSQQQQQQASQYQRDPQAQLYAAQLQQLQQAAYYQQAAHHHQQQQAPTSLVLTSDLQAASAAQQFQQAQLQQLSQLQQMQQAAQLQDLNWGAGFPQSQLDNLLLARGISAQNQGHVATSAQQQQQLSLGAMLSASCDPSTSLPHLLYLQNQQAQELELQQYLQHQKAQSAEAASATAQQSAVAHAEMTQKQATATAMKQKQRVQSKQQQHTKARFQQQQKQQQREQQQALLYLQNQQAQELELQQYLQHQKAQSAEAASATAQQNAADQAEMALKQASATATTMKQQQRTQTQPKQQQNTKGRSQQQQAKAPPWGVHSPSHVSAPSSGNKEKFHASSVQKEAAPAPLPYSEAETVCHPVGSSPPITNDSTEEGEKTADRFKKVPGAMVVPCRARGMAMDHNFKTAYFRISKNMEHGEELICSYFSCRNAGIKFRYCIKCKNPVSKRTFYQRHNHGHTNIANLSGKVDGEGNNSDEGTFVPSSISPMENKHSSSGHAILPPSSLLGRGVAPNLPSVAAAGPATEMMTESLGFGPNALPPSDIAKQEDSSKKAAKAPELKNVMSKGAAAVYPSSAVSQLITSSQCSVVSAHPSTATSPSGQLDKGKGGSESVPKSCGGDGHGSVLDGRKRRWSSLLVGRPALGDSNAMSAWLLEVLVVSDLDKPLKDDDNVARAELASASINDGSSQKRPKLESEIRDDLQTTKKAEAHNWGNGGSVPSFASLKYKRRGHQH